MSFSRSLQSVVFLLIVLGIVGLALGGYLAPFSRTLLNPIVSAQTWIATRYQAVQNFIQAPQDTIRLRQRNAELEAEVARLQAQVIELQQRISETSILSALVDFARANPEYSYQGAAVIGYDTSPFLRYVLINRGSDQGLRRGMPVVTQQGLVGRVVAVTSSAARVQLITDTTSIVNVHLDPSGAQAVLTGQITGEVLLEMIPQDAVIEVGDLVLTSGLGGGYPPNLLIGQVSGVRSQAQDLFQRATVQTVVDFSQLEIVLVITNFRPVDIEPLLPQQIVP
jgi:rod shape-determining protein MreC